MTGRNRPTLEAANEAYLRRHPGERADRQPVQSFIEGAQHFRADTIASIRQGALDALSSFAPDGDALARAMVFNGRERASADDVHRRVTRKLETEPVEDYRIDFEDGFGMHPDAEEDAEVERCANATAAAMRAGDLPPTFGIRVKPLTRELAARSLQTVDLFVQGLLSATGGTLPASLIVTLAKVTVAEQVAYLADHLDTMEQRLGLSEGSLRMEIMVETPRAVMDWTGRCPLPGYVEAARGRLVAASLGTYDYTAALGITAAHQRQRHPACEHARLVMQLAFAGTGVRVSDGSTAILPVGPVERVHDAWRLHHGDVKHALKLGIYSGWDLHPAQLVSRYAAVYAFYATGLDAATRRLANFLESFAKPAAPRDIADDLATGQALLNFLLRAVACGAADRATIAAQTGIGETLLDGRPVGEVLSALG